MQTADNRLLPRGTGYITDVGMCGSYNSIIGANPTEIIIKEKWGYHYDLNQQKMMIN